mmetsp:Transcript_15359/g.39576  ORF Transcript_15359/g.39576 Transcript_15359/m.39576 type:complete len:201 (+) Transcript_15359:347-949(+)
MGQNPRPRSCPPHLLDCSARAEARSADCRGGSPRQRQADPGDSGCRRPSGCAPSLPLRWLGTAHGDGNARMGSRGRCRRHRSVELSPHATGVEDRTCAGCRELRRDEACHVHPTVGSAFCRDLQRSRTATWCLQRRHRIWPDGLHPRRASRRGQGWLYRLHRDRANAPPADRRNWQEDFSRAWGQVAGDRLRVGRPRCSC